MKKINLIFLFPLLFFLFSNVVHAGVCDGKEILSKDGYCDFGYMYHLHYIVSSHETYSVYEVLDSSNSLSGQNDEEYAFCLDPNLYGPDGKDYKHAREIDITEPSDEAIYRVYQQYVNSLASSPGDANKMSYLKKTDSVLRYIVTQNGYDIGSGNDYDWSNVQASGAVDFYNRANELRMWINPLKIISSEDYNEEENIHIFNFEIQFADDTSQYFYQNNNDLVNGDYNIGFGDAYFKFYKLKINGGAFDLGNTVDGMLVDGTPNNSESIEITKYSSNPNKTINVSLRLTDEKYNSIKEQDPDGKVYVSMEYETFNPMSDENVFVTKYFVNNRGSLAYDNLTQRMVVFSKYVAKGETRSDGLDSSDNRDLYYYCKQEGNKFYYNNTEIGFSEYINQCTCDNIDASVLNAANKSIYNSSSCVNESKVNVKNTLKNCGVRLSDDDNKIIYEKQTPINRFCTLTCTETVKFNDMVEHFTAFAGRYFEITDKLKINFNKSCKMDIKKDLFENDYRSLLREQITAYNDWQQDLAIQNAQLVSVPNGTDRYGRTQYKYVYQYSYVKYYLDGDSIKSENVSGTLNSKGSPKPTKKYSIFIEKTGKLKNDTNGIFDQLDSCSDYLMNIENFYNPSNEVKFYYNQSILDVNKPVRNDNTKYTAVDDSELVPTETSNSKGGNYSSLSSKNFNIMNDSGKTSITAKNPQNDINREESYNFEYTPAISKYVDTFSGKIGILNGKNKIKLGEVYNILVNAIEKDKNEDYYYFKSLGDEGQITKYYKDKSTTDRSAINSYGELESLIRKCDFEIKNNMVDCKEPNCPDTTKPSLNLVFRIVDEHNIDPNGRLNKTDNDSGFKNWKNLKGELVKKELEKTDTYNPDNLEYSFTLDSATIKAIREYNKSVSYSSINSTSTLDCSDAGNECISTFIDEAHKAKPNLNGINIDKQFATDISGSNNWRYLKCDSSSKCEIITVKRKSADYWSYNAYLNKQTQLRNILASDSKNKDLNP